jgi:threonine aldolase
MNFESDNVWGVWPEMLDALGRAAAGTATSYGDDQISPRVKASFNEIFEHEVAVFPVISGTAANALALATLVPPHGAILCHASSHIAVDECGAPEFFSHGAKLVPLSGPHGKIEPASVADALSGFVRGSVHQVQPAAISIAQATELGTVYRPNEIAALAELARRSGLKLHMDGARFANALASLGCSPAEATWRAGVDVISFGATKGGAFGAEAVIFFNPRDAADFDYRRKRAGHLLSKMRFVSAQLETYIADGRWLTHAARANSLARILASGLTTVRGAEIAHPIEANMVFALLPDPIVAKLRQRGACFYNWSPPSNGRTLVRLVTSFATPEEEITKFVAAANDAYLSG